MSTVRKNQAIGKLVCSVIIKDSGKFLIYFSSHIGLTNKCIVISMFSFKKTGKVHLYWSSERASIPRTVSVWGVISEELLNYTSYIIGLTQHSINLCWVCSASLCCLAKQSETYSWQVVVIPYNFSLSCNFAIKLITFLSDRYLVHHTIAIRTWLEQHPQIHVLPWPSSFGDIMPIDEVWKNVCAELNDQRVTVHTTEALFEEVKTTLTIFVTLTTQLA